MQPLFFGNNLKSQSGIFNNGLQLILGEAALQMPRTPSSPHASSMRLRVNAPLRTKLLSPV